MESPTNKDLLKFIWHYIKPHKWLFLMAAFAALSWSIDAMVWPYIIKVVVDIFVANENHRAAAWPALQYPVFGGLLFWLLIEAGFRSQGFLLAKAIPRLEANIRMGMFDHIQRHSPKYFNEHFAGSLANKITDMTTQVTSIVQNVIILFLPTLTSCLLALFFLGEINRLFIWIIVLWVLTHFSICIAFSHICNQSQHEHGAARTSLLGKIVDSFTNNFAVNLFYRFNFEKNYINSYQKNEAEKNYVAKRWVEMMRFCLGQLCFWVGCITINGLMLYLWLNHQMTSGEVIQVFNTTWSIIVMLWISGTEIPKLYQAMGLAKQALTAIHEPQDLNDQPDAFELKVNKGEITFQNVTFHYGKKKVFENKTVRIRGGEKVGLVGYSGAGKTTFSNLLLRLFPVESGAIMIDGQNIAHVTLESLRRNVVLIPQEPMLFHRSIFENIQYGRIEADEQEVHQAAKAAHCADFIASRHEGYQTQVGERGTKLSGGEKQRIALARAIIANARILILDEATSALDSVTEMYIQDTLNTLMQGKTTLVIAHRLSTLARMDRILVFDQGKIIEEGSHQELLTLGKHYAKLWQMQAGGFLQDGDELEE